MIVCIDVLLSFPAVIYLSKPSFGTMQGCQIFLGTTYVPKREKYTK
jgi:hypothetical protein